MSKEIFGKVLRELRHEKQLTQEKVAELAEVDRTYIYRLESGLRDPSFSVFLRIATALDVAPEDLVKKVTTAMKANKGGKKRK